MNNATIRPPHPQPTAEWQQQIVDWNATQAEFPACCVHQLFEQQVLATPHAIALIDGDQHVTYQALNARANQLAHRLQGMGVGSTPGATDLVGICIERSVHLFVGLLGIFKAGGAYVPLDASYPSERITYMLQDAAVRVLLTTTTQVAQLALTETAGCQVVCLDEAETTPDQATLDNPSSGVQPHNLAYCIYTSGSTGNPKGALMEHRSLVNMLWWHKQTRPSVTGVKTLQFCAVSFDFSFHEIFATLCLGGTLVLVTEEIRRNGVALAEFICDQAIEKLFLPVTALVQLAEATQDGPLPTQVREVITTGELLQITPAIAHLFRHTGALLHNHYGATEFQDATTLTLQGDPADWPTLVPVGRPLSNVQVYILDEQGAPVAVDEEGELCIGGMGVARGYLNRPELTQQKFVPNPFAAGLLYKTGDLARYRPVPTGHPVIEHLGRMDQQVKIRGFRVELGEIESALVQHPAVRECAVVARADETGNQQLVGYLIPTADKSATTGQLEHDLWLYLQAHLPEYMVPTRFVQLETMPLTPSGKLDRRALPAPVWTRPALTTALVNPRSASEQRLAELWRELLHLEHIGIHDNFFELGGTSLLLTQLHKAVVAAFAVKLSAVALFQYPTIYTLAQHLAELTNDAPQNGQGSTASRPRQGARPQPTQLGAAAPTAIAIIGLAGRFPGAQTIEQFWENLCAGVESITFFTDEELEQQDASLRRHPDYVKAGGVLPDIEQFDAAFFGYSPKEAAVTDPQQRILLECAWEAFERAGYNPESYPGLVGVYAGSSMSTYLLNNVGPSLGITTQQPFIETDMAQFQAKIGNDRSYLATRISYKLNLKGPSINVQTACSTSLVAVHLACQSLLAGECDMALAGGVSVVVPHRGGYLYEEGMVRSPDGHCRAFDAAAQGTLFGNGAGLVLLKRLDEALADHDPIIAVIKGTAINNDGGVKVGYTAPSVEGQATVISEALRMAGVDASTIGYVETHGTATNLGDPIEVAALTQAFAQSSTADSLPLQQCAIGSVKTNIGHLDEAAGIAGLIKTALALHHQQLPPSLHFVTPNPAIDFAQSPFYVNTALSAWPAQATPRRAGVSSFGVGGTNSHVVLEEAPVGDRETGRQGDRQTRQHQILALSAQSEQALNALVQRYSDYVTAHPATNLADLCFTANTGRKHFAQRVAVVADSMEKMAQQLQKARHAKADAPKTAQAQPKIAFLFTGHGAQYREMSRELYQTQPLFRHSIDRCDEIIRAGNYLDCSLLDILYLQGDPAEKALIDIFAYAQPALFALEYALAQLWLAWGITPDVVMGHSTGEYVAACVAGVFSLEDGLKLVAERGSLMQNVAQAGGMVAVTASEADVTTLLQEIVPMYPDMVAIAAINGPESVVVSGVREALDALCAALRLQAIKHERLAIPVAAHSPLMRPVLAEFAPLTEQVHYATPTITLISNVTGEIATSEVTTAEYWRRHLLQPVRFAQSMQTIATLEVDCLVEIGPNPVLLGMGRKCLPEHHGLWLPSLRAKRGDWQQLLDSLGQLYTQGVNVNWAGLDNDQSAHTISAPVRRKLVLPTYPFQRQPYWIAPTPPQAIQAGVSTPLTPLIDTLIQSPRLKEIVTETRFNTERLPFLADHTVFGEVVSPGACQMALVLQAAHLAYPNRAIQLVDVVLPQALVIAKDASRTVQVIFSPEAQPTGAEPATAFEVISFLADQPSDTLQTHASGRLAFAPIVPLRQAQGPGVELVETDLAALQARCSIAVDLAAMAAQVAAQNTYFGPSFRWLDAIWRGETEVLGRLVLPDAIGTLDGYPLHPGVLDACWQLVNALHLDVLHPETRLPFAMDRLVLAAPVTGRTWWGYIQQVAPASPGEMQQPPRWQVQLLDETGAVLLTVTNFTERTAPRHLLLGTAAWREWLYRVEWQREPSFGHLPAYLPPPATLYASLQEQATALVRAPEIQQQQIALGHLETLCIDYILAAFAKTGIQFEAGRQWRSEQLVRQLGVIPAYHRLLERLLQMLAEAGILALTQNKASWQVLRTPPLRAPQAERQRVQAAYGPVIEAELALLDRCATHLSEVLRGVQNPLELLFPGGDASFVNRTYQNSPIAKAMNRLAQNAIKTALAQLPPGCGVRILEIGAGTGGTTAGLLPLLPAEQTAYLFTDIGAGFLRTAQEKFADYPFVRYQTLDIEQPPAQQGIDLQAYDIVLAANVLHATRDLPTTLAHVQQLLAPGGLMVLLEDTQASGWVDLTFGLTDGWWRFRDHRHQHPLLTANQWQDLLLTTGFQTVATLPGTDTTDNELGQAVFLAKASDTVVNTGRTWLLLTDDGELGEALATQLRQRGEQPILVYPGDAYQLGCPKGEDSNAVPSCQIRPDHAEDYQRLVGAFPNLYGVVQLWGIANPSIESAEELELAVQAVCAPTLHLVQALLHAAGTTQPHLWLVTRDAQAVQRTDRVTGFAQAARWGLGRTIALEHPELHCTCLDLAGDIPLGAQATALCAQLTSTAPAGSTSSPAEGETQVALRADGRYVARLSSYQPVQSTNLSIGAEATYLVTGGLGGLGLEVARWLAEQGAQHLLLLGRSQPTPAAQQHIAELQALGAEITVVQADVSQQEQVAQALAQVPSAFPLRGVIHAAGILDDGALLQQTWARFAKVMAPKVAGAWHLHALTQDLPLDFFVLFASASGLLGSRGQANHAAANALLDSLARYRRAHNLPALSIDWGSWSEIGSAAAIVQRDATQLALRGEGVITPEQGIQSFAYLLHQAEAQVAVMPITWEKLLATQPANASFFAQLAQRETTPVPASQPVVATQRSFSQTLAQASPEQRRTLLMQQVQTLVTRVLGLSATQSVNWQAGLMDLGMDSLMAIELRNLLARSLEKSLPATLFFTYPTIPALIDYLLQTLFADDASAVPVATAKAAAILHIHEAMLPVETADDRFETLPEDVAAALGKEWEQLTALLGN